jgi:hypothetical protein
MASAPAAESHAGGAKAAAGIIELALAVAAAVAQPSGAAVAQPPSSPQSGGHQVQENFLA